MNMELSFLVDGEVYKARKLNILPQNIAKRRTSGYHGEGEDVLDQGEKGNGHHPIIRER